MKEKIQRILCTWFGLGLAPVASGTFGTLGAIPIVLLVGRCPFCLFVSSLFIFILGVWASNEAEQLYGRKDPGQVVIDEVAGMCLTMVGLPLTGASLIAGFLVFRAIDIIKAPPLSWCETAPRGWGIMLDDLVGGAIACALLHLLLFFAPGALQIF